MYMHVCTYIYIYTHTYIYIYILVLHVYTAELVGSGSSAPPCDHAFGTARTSTKRA